MLLPATWGVSYLQCEGLRKSGLFPGTIWGDMISWLELWGAVIAIALETVGSMIRVITHDQIVDWCLCCLVARFIIGAFNTKMLVFVTLGRNNLL